MADRRGVPARPRSNQYEIGDTRVTPPGSTKLLYHRSIHYQEARAGLYLQIPQRHDFRRLRYHRIVLYWAHKLKVVLSSTRTIQAKDIYRVFDHFQNNREAFEERKGSLTIEEFLATFFDDEGNSLQPEMAREDLALVISDILCFLCRELTDVTTALQENAHIYRDVQQEVQRSWNIAVPNEYLDTFTQEMRPNLNALNDLNEHEFEGYQRAYILLRCTDHHLSPNRLNPIRRGDGTYDWAKYFQPDPRNNCQDRNTEYHGKKVTLIIKRGEETLKRDANYGFFDIEKTRAAVLTKFGADEFGNDCEQTWYLAKDFGKKDSIALDIPALFPVIDGDHDPEYVPDNHLTHKTENLCESNPTETSSGKRLGVGIITPYEKQNSVHQEALSKTLACRASAHICTPKANPRLAGLQSHVPSFNTGAFPRHPPGFCHPQPSRLDDHLTATTSRNPFCIYLIATRPVRLRTFRTSQLSNLLPATPSPSSRSVPFSQTLSDSMEPRTNLPVDPEDPDMEEIRLMDLALQRPKFEIAMRPGSGTDNVQKMFRAWSRNNQTPSESEWQAGVIRFRARESFDDDWSTFLWLSDYHPLYVWRAGDTMLTGIADQVRFHLAPYSHAKVQISHCQYQQSKRELSRWGNTEFTTRGLLGNTMQVDRLSHAEYHAIICEHNGPECYPAGRFPPPDFQVVRVQFVVQRPHLRHMPHKPMLQVLRKRNSSFGDGPNRLEKTFDRRYGHVWIEMFFAGKNNEVWHFARNFLQASINNISPYHELFVDPAIPRLPSLESMKAGAETRFTAPTPATIFFEDNEERSARLAYGEKAENDYHSVTSETATRVAKKAIFCRPYPAAEGQPQRWIGFLPKVGFNEILPCHDESFRLDLENPDVTMPILPTQETGFDELLDDFVNAIVAASERARESCPEDEEMWQAKICYQVSRFFKDAADVAMEEVREKIIQSIAYKLVPRSLLSDEETKERRKAKSDLLIPREDKATHRERIRDWALHPANGNMLRVPPKDQEDTIPGLRCVRVPSDLDWLEGGRFAFYAVEPLAPGWKIEWGDRPPVRYHLPTVPFHQTDLAATARNLANAAKDKQVAVNIAYDTRETTATVNVESLAAMTFGEDDADPMAQMSRWLLNFDPIHSRMYPIPTFFPSLHHLLQRSRGKAYEECDYFRTDPSHALLEPDEATRAGVLSHPMMSYDSSFVPRDLSDAWLERFKQFDVNQQAVIQDTENLNHGFLVLSGGPGTGKSTLISFLLQVMWYLPVEQSVDEDFEKTYHDGLRSCDNTARARLEQFEAQDHERDDAENEAEGKDSRLDTKTSEVKRVAPGSDAVLNWSDIKGIQKEAPRPKIFVRQQVVAVGITNKQCDDMAERLQEELKNVTSHPKVYRTSSILATVTMLQNPGDNSMEYVPDQAMFEVLQMFITMTKQGHAEMKKSPKASLSDMSLDKAVRKFIDNSGTDIAARIRGYEQSQKDNPGAYRQNSAKDHALDLKTVINMILSQADAVVCTPVGAYHLQKLETTFDPRIIWVDEVFRSREASAYAVLSTFKHAKVRLLSGDQHQGRPLVLSRNAHKSKTRDNWFCNPFGPQLEMSLAHRMLRANASQVHQLQINYRTVNGAYNVHDTLFNHGQGVEKHHNVEGPEVVRLMLFLRSLGAPERSGPSIALNTRGPYQVRRGKSLMNQRFGAVAVNVLIQCFRANLCVKVPTADRPGERMSVMIITPYQSQCQWLKKRVRDLSSREIVHELVEVRTKEEAQGAQADIAIVDLTRTDGLGFVTEPAMGEVLTSRGKRANIFILNDDAWKDRKPVSVAGWVAELVAYMKARKAIVELPDPGRPQECQRCRQYHRGAVCETAVKCYACGQLGHNPSHCVVALPLTGEIPAGTSLNQQMPRFRETTKLFRVAGRHRRS
ncbi:hypothetical protein F4780DRAFT_774473 [Xylariomycetidae sp. FL0641]|nr:hypothetical protein F4780DRAFT_774473 [Xylariomycetidae sp. FL0641]